MDTPKERLMPIFNAHPHSDVIYETNDGQLFISNHDACNHQRDVLEVRQLTDAQLPKLHRRAEVFNINTEAEGASDRAEAPEGFSDDWNVEQLKEAVVNETDVEVLKLWLTFEESEKGRKTAIEAINDRIAELTAA